MKAKTFVIPALALMAIALLGESTGTRSMAPLAMPRVSVRQASGQVSSRLTVTALDGSPLEQGYEVVDRGYGVVATKITASGDYRITQDDSSTYANEQIVIGPNVSGRIELSNLNLMNSSGSDPKDESTIQVDPTSNVTLYFDGDNIIRRNGEYYPGIGYYGPKGSFTGQLTIEGSSEGSTFIQGALYGDGIGGLEKSVWGSIGGKEQAAEVGPIVINSGNLSISAFSVGASAIGSGTDGYLQSVTINGGNLKLSSKGSASWSGAVIGGTDGGSCGTITINGGRIALSTSGSSVAPAIGAPNYGTCDEIVINGGNIVAKTYQAPSIGGGAHGECGRIEINGGTITTEVQNKTGGEIGNASDISEIEVNGGSIKSSFTKDPVNKDGEPVYLLKLDNIPDVHSVKVGDQDFAIDSNHPDDQSLYLYVPGKDATITANDASGEETFDVVYSQDGTFEIGGTSEPNEAPVIHAEDKRFEEGTVITDEMLLEGVTVSDDHDENIQPIVLSNNIQNDTVGTYQVVYQATDSGGLSSTTEANVSIYAKPESNEAPTILAEDKYIKLGTEITDELLLEGVSVTDDHDQGLKAKVLSHNIDSSAIGTYEVTYQTIDSDGLVATKTINAYVYMDFVNVNSVPVLSGSDKTIAYGSTFGEAEALEGITAYDEEDEDLTKDIQVVFNPVDTSKPGEYEVTYSVVDSQGAVGYLTINVTVLEAPEIGDADRPVITVEPDITITAGETWNDAEALKYVTAVDKDGNPITDIEVILNEVDPSKPGTYRIGFKATDENGVSQEAYVNVTVMAPSGNDNLAILVAVPVLAVVLTAVLVVAFAFVYKSRKRKEP